MSAARFRLAMSSAIDSTVLVGAAKRAAGARAKMRETVFVRSIVSDVEDVCTGKSIVDSPSNLTVDEIQIVFPIGIVSQLF
jgi:hypothetical protein